jgi:hypothetical protein
MGNLSFERQGGGWKKLTGWLSLSTDTFKSGHAQLSFLPEFRSGLLSFRGASKTPTRNLEVIERDSGFALMRAPE